MLRWVLCEPLQLPPGAPCAGAGGPEGGVCLDQGQLQHVHPLHQRCVSPLPAVFQGLSLHDATLGL